MKSLILALSFSFLMATNARAASPSSASAEFLHQFIQAVNMRLTEINEARALAGERLYCAQLSPMQIQKIQSVFRARQNSQTGAAIYRDLDSMTVGDFIAAAADQLYCYPLAWFKPGRQTVGGFIFNTKAYVMDTIVLKEALQTMVSRAPGDQELLSNLTYIY